MNIKGPGARYTVTNKIGCKVFQVACVRLKTRLSKEVSFNFGFVLISKFESKMAESIDLARACAAVFKCDKN